MLIDYDTWAGASPPEALSLSPCFALSLCYNFYCVLFLPLLALLSPNFASYSVPLSLFNLIFHVSYPFPCQSPLPWRYVGLQKGEGKTCDTQCSCWRSHPRRLWEPWLSWDRNVYIIATVATLIRPPRKHEHTQTHHVLESKLKKKKKDYHDYVLMLTVLNIFSTLFIRPNRWLVHLWDQWGKGCANKQGHKGAGSSIFLHFHSVLTFLLHHSMLYRDSILQFKTA